MKKDEQEPEYKPKFKEGDFVLIIDNPDTIGQVKGNSCNELTHKTECQVLTLNVDGKRHLQILKETELELAPKWVKPFFKRYEKELNSDKIMNKYNNLEKRTLSLEANAVLLHSYIDIIDDLSERVEYLESKTSELEKKVR